MSWRGRLMLHKFVHLWRMIRVTGGLLDTVLINEWMSYMKILFIVLHVSTIFHFYDFTFIAWLNAVLLLGVSCWSETFTSVTSHLLHRLEAACLLGSSRRSYAFTTLT